MFSRKIIECFQNTLRAFPVVVLTGARQTGKSTLCKQWLKNTHRYVTLEDPDIRAQALSDPKTFLANNPPPLVLDEIQYAPELVNYIQTRVDQNRTEYGQYVLTGSQNFLVMEKVSQSLAGRAALLDLYPLSATEISNSPPTDPLELAQWILRGNYPELCARPELERTLWIGSYIRLYIERDVRLILNVSDLDVFEKFIRMLAIRTGQILNQSELSKEIGVSVPTIKRWLSLLQSSYQIVLLQPYYANLGKRLIKSPKIYFTDTGLASYLMGIHDAQTLLGAPQFGALFETMLVMEHIKFKSFFADQTPSYYFRTQDGLEVDLFWEKNLKLYAREFKSSRTVNPFWTQPFQKLETLFKKQIDSKILAPVNKSQFLNTQVKLLPWWESE